MKLLITTQAVDTEDPLLGFFHEWIRTFSETFERVDVICLRRGQVDLPENVFVHSLGKEIGESRIRYVVRFYRYFSRIFFRERVDFVFFHMGAIYNVLAFPFFLLRPFFGTKFYWWKTHGHINLLGRVALHCVDVVYTASEESFPISTGKKRVVGHAITPYREVVPRPYLPPRLRIGCVGRVSKIKRQDTVARVALLLRERNIPAVITCVGPIVDQIFYNEIQDFIETHHLESEIAFVGGKTHTETQALLQGFDILVHPSETGSIDKVVLEAMNVGVLPIARREAYEAVLGEYGLTAMNDDPESYVRIIEHIRTLDKDEYQDYVSRLQSYVQRNHSLETLSGRIFGTS